MHNTGPLGLVGILFWGSEASSALAIYSWLSCGLLVLLFVTIGVIRKAWRERELRRQYRPATPGLHHAQRKPQNHALRWRKSNTEGYMATSLVLQVPQRGVYAILLTIKDFEGAQLITQGKQGTALVYAGGGKGKVSMPLRSIAWNPVCMSWCGLSPARLLLSIPKFPSSTKFNPRFIP